MSLQRETWKNLGITGALQGVTSVFQTGTNIALAWMLLPEDFGIVALAMIFIRFITRFQDFGLGTAIVQKRGDVTDLLYTANLIRTLVAVVLITVAWLGAPLFAEFYERSEVSDVVRVIALTFLLNSAVFIPRTLLRREMGFRKIFVAESTGSFFNSLTKLSLAVAGFGFWSIVIGGLAGQLVETILYHAQRPHSFRFAWKKAAAHELYGFSRFVFVAGIVTLASQSLDKLTVGRVLGVAAVGFLDQGYRWGVWLSHQLARIVQRVVLPTFAGIQDDQERLRRGLLKSSEIMVGVAAPAFLGLAAVSPDFVRSVLGPRWDASAVVLSICAVCGLLRTLTDLLRTVLVSLGQVRYDAASAGATMIVTVVTVVPATLYFDIEGAALSITLAALCGYLILIGPAIQAVGATWRQYAGVVVAPIVAAALMAVGVLVLRLRIVEVSDMSARPRLLLSAAAGAVLYTLLLCALTRRSPMAWWRYVASFRTPLPEK